MSDTEIWDLVLGMVIGFALGYLTNEIRRTRTAAQNAAKQAAKARRHAVKARKEAHRAALEAHALALEAHEMSHEDGQGQFPLDLPPLPPLPDDGEPRSERGSLGRGAKGETGEQGEPGEPGNRESPFARKMLIAVVAITAASAIFAGIAWGQSKSTLADVRQRSIDNQAELADINARQHALDAATAQANAQSDCQQRVLEDMLVALQARSQFATQGNLTQLDVLNAQLLFLGQLGGRTPQADQRAAFQAYVDAIGVAKKALLDEVHTRQHVPYPLLGSLKACRTAGQPRGGGGGP